MSESQLNPDDKGTKRFDFSKNLPTKADIKKKENFFKTLCSEIYTIPNIPWVKTEGATGEVMGASGGSLKNIFILSFSPLRKVF